MKYKRNVIHTSVRCSLSFALLFGMLMGSTASAEIQSGCGQINQATVEIKWPRVEEKVQLNTQHWVGYAQVEAWQKQGDILLIDIRPKSKQEAQPIAEALNIQLHEVERQRALFKGKRLVLVGAGFDQVTLDKAVAQLTETGVEAYALTGGVRSLVGTPYGKHLSINPFEITPEEFWLGSAATHWQVVTFGVPQQQFSQLPQEPLALLAHEGNIKEKLSVQKKSNFIEYVFIAPDNASTQALQRSFRNSGLIKNSVWLQGGMQAYQNYIKQQRLMQIHAGKSLLRSCGSL